MRIVRKESLVAVPWKNGGGITREVMRVPAAGDAFRWRVSIAQIDASGPFSNFAGYRRTMVLLRGAGLRLNIAGGPDPDVTLTLCEVGQMASFDGASATVCELLDGPCTDLNLMVSSSLTGVHAWVERLSGPQPLRPAPGSTVLAVAVFGSVEFDAGRHDTTRLQAWDLAVVGPQDSGIVISPAGAGAPLVFFAALDDNST